MRQVGWGAILFAVIGIKYIAGSNMQSLTWEFARIFIIEKLLWELILQLSGGCVTEVLAFDRTSVVITNDSCDSTLERHN